jgi:hypothetical protein
LHEEMNDMKIRDDKVSLLYTACLIALNLSRFHILM